MSKGSPIVAFRMSSVMMGDLELAVEKANKQNRDEPYTLSSWVKKAVMEKLAHLKRSGRKTAKLGRCTYCQKLLDELCEVGAEMAGSDGAVYRVCNGCCGEDNPAYKPSRDHSNG